MNLKPKVSVNKQIDAERLQPVAWVVGGSSGLGFALAKACLAQGYRVVLFARDAERLRAARSELRMAAGCSEALIDVEVLDATDGLEVNRVFEHRFGIDGRLDLLINAVGKSCRATIWEPNHALYREMMEVNFFAVVYCTLKALPWLAQRRGTVVQIASLAAKATWPWIAPYGAAKAALASFSNNVRLEAAGKVNVLLVCPGPIRREDAGRRYGAQATGEGMGTEASDRVQQPGAGAPVKAICPDWLAMQVLKAVRSRRLLLVYPFKARVLFLAEAISSRLGFWLSRRLNRKTLGR